MAPTSANVRMIRTVAGTGEAGFAGDGGPAVSACLNEPKSLALDSGRRHLYIADSENHLIRRVDLVSGLISTVAGQADAATRPARGQEEEEPSSWLEEDDPLGGPTVAMPERFTQQTDLSGTVRFLVGTAPKVGRFQGDKGPAARAALNFPTAVAVDEQGAVYIADTMNHRIRKVEAHTGAISTVAGTGHHRFSGDGGPAEAAALNEPAALALDGQGHLYIADQSNNRVRCLDLATGLISTVAGTGEAAYNGDGMPAIEAALAGPSGLALDRDGRLYIADTFNGRIRMVDLATGMISTVVGDGGEYRYQGRPAELSMSLSRPYGIALEPDGHLLITDSDSHLIRRWDRNRKIITLVAGNGMAGYRGDGGEPQGSSLNYPFGVAVDAQGNIYIADTFNHRIRLIAG
jgi:sugar lactone lactonase YvrE